MRHTVCGQRKRSPAEVDLVTVFHEHGRLNDRSRFAFTQHLFEATAVVLATLAERVGKPCMPNVGRFIRRECAGTENMVRMYMRENHVPDRKPGVLANRSAQRRAIAEASPGIHDRDRLTPDDESDVGDGSCVSGRSFLVHAFTDMNSRGNLLQREFGRARRKPWKAAKTRAAQ